MPEATVCMGCGALVPRGEAHHYRCPPCAARYDERRGRHRAAYEKKRPPRAKDPVLDSPAWRRLRKAILERDGYLCQLRLPGCTVTATTVDHIIPRARGGAPLDPTNLQAACRRCNAGKGARTA